MPGNILTHSLFHLLLQWTLLECFYLCRGWGGFCYFGVTKSCCPIEGGNIHFCILLLCIQAGLILTVQLSNTELLILLPPCSECWDYKRALLPTALFLHNHFHARPRQTWSTQDAVSHRIITRQCWTQHQKAQLLLTTVGSHDNPLQIHD